MANVDAQLFKRNIEILQDQNDSILTLYKQLKKQLKHGGKDITDEMIATMKCIVAQTGELHEEVIMRLPNTKIPVLLIRYV